MAGKMKLERLVKLDGATVRRIRGEQRQADFAAAVGASDGTVVSRWENGHSPPSPVFTRALIRLAKARGVALNGQAEAAAR